MKQINSNEFRVYGGELYVSEDGFRRIFVEASTDIPMIESKMFADIILGHFHDEHDDESLTFDETDYVNVYTIMNHVDVELNKHSLMFARTFVKLFDAAGETLMISDTEEDLPYLNPSAAHVYFRTLKTLQKYLQIAETWWKLR